MISRFGPALLVVCVLFLAAPVARVSGQQVADPRIVLLTAESDRLTSALKLDEGLAKAEDAIALAEQLKDRVGLAMAYRAKGVALLRAAKARDAMVWYERSLAEFEALKNIQGIGGNLIGLTAAAITIGDQAKAREYGEKALRIFDETGDKVGRARILVNLVASGLYRDEVGKWIPEILETGQRANLPDLIAAGYRHRAAALFATGDLAGARAAYEAAIAAHAKFTDDDALASLYLNLGRVSRAHGDYEGAIRHYDQAIALLEPTKERYVIVEAVNSKAVALGNLGRHKESIAAYERGLALAKESGNQRVIDFMEGNLAGGLAGAGEHERAIPLILAAIARKPELSLLGFRYNSLAISLTHVGRASEALEPITEAVRIAREIKNVDSLAPRLSNRAWILKKLDRFAEALADIQECIVLTEGVRARLIPSDFLKRGYGERSQYEYLALTDLLSRLGRKGEALEAAELGRGRAFLDLLAARSAASPAEAASKGADLSSGTAGRPLDLAGMQVLTERLKTTLVSFAVTDEDTLVWVLRPGIEPGHVRLPVGREKLAKLVAATLAPLNESGSSTTRGDEDLTALPMRGLGLLALTRDDKSSWRELYKTLIEPIRAHLPARGGRITIVPHGPLFRLSFAALQTSSGRYLVEDFELHYAPAASALEFTGKRQQAVAANTNGPWAIVGNPAALPIVRDKPLPPLPGAAREIAAIAALAPGGRTLRLDGARADESALAGALETARPSLVHFATHGFVFDDGKQAPFLALNRRGPGEAEDGRLTLDEVYGLRLMADLVVLSACRTGSGQLSSDGVLGLTRGFFYAGAPSVLATFWDVTDEATANLMAGFYRNYIKARAKGGSLRAAQLALLQDLRAGRVAVSAGGRRIALPEHPILWAAFFLTGEP